MKAWRPLFKDGGPLSLLGKPSLNRESLSRPRVLDYQVSILFENVPLPAMSGPTTIQRFLPLELPRKIDVLFFPAYLLVVFSLRSASASGLFPPSRVILCESVLHSLEM